MRLVMMGTGPFAAPTFRALLDSSHEVLALVTRPDRPTHGKRSTVVNPMRDIARERGLPVFEPESINAPEACEQVKALRPDLLVVCDYGQILSKQALGLAPLGGINLHASLLPKYRGAAPINWAIYHGERETGVSVIHMTPKLDAGPVLVQRRYPLGDDALANDVERELSELGVSAVNEAIGLLERGEADRGVVQDPSLASGAPRLKKTDGQVDWSRSAEAIHNQARAFTPWPKTYTFWLRQGEPLRLILERVKVLSDNGGQPAGAVLQADASGLHVACGEGSLSIESLQPAGKRVMTADEFVRGYPLRVGDRFGKESPV